MTFYFCPCRIGLLMRSFKVAEGAGCTLAQILSFVADTSLSVFARSTALILSNLAKSGPRSSTLVLCDCMLAATSSTRICPPTERPVSSTTRTMKSNLAYWSFKLYSCLCFYPPGISFILLRCDMMWSSFWDSFWSLRWNSTASSKVARQAVEERGESWLRDRLHQSQSPLSCHKARGVAGITAARHGLHLPL